MVLVAGTAGLPARLLTAAVMAGKSADVGHLVAAERPAAVRGNHGDSGNGMAVYIGEGDGNGPSGFDAGGGAADHGVVVFRCVDPVIAFQGGGDGDSRDGRVDVECQSRRRSTLVARRIGCIIGEVVGSCRKRYDRRYAPGSITRHRCRADRRCSVVQGDRIAGRTAEAFDGRRGVVGLVVAGDAAVARRIEERCRDRCDRSGWGRGKGLRIDDWRGRCARGRGRTAAFNRGRGRCAPGGFGGLTAGWWSGGGPHRRLGITYRLGIRGGR